MTSEDQIDELLLLIDELVNDDPRDWSIKRDAILERGGEIDRVNIAEFCRWFQP